MVSSVTFPVDVGGDGSTVTDDDNISTGLGNGGHLLRFVPAMSQVVVMAQTSATKATAANASAVAAAASQTAAASSAGAAAASQSAAAVSAADAQPKPRLAYANFAAFPVTGAAGRVYEDQSNAKCYVWDSGAYAETFRALGALTVAQLNTAVTDADVATTAQLATAGIANTVTASAATTLTSTKTLLQITPTGYGVAVTLPDATTMAVGWDRHVIDNKGTYPVKVLDSAGTLLGFVFAGVCSTVGLVNNSTAAGVWSISNLELVGASAQLFTTSALFVVNCIDLGGGRELLITGGSTSVFHGIVYDNTTNTFGAPTLIRTAANGASSASCLVSTDKALVCSCNATTGFEAVILTISGTTLTVNTAATTTLSANLSSFAQGCGLIAVGTSFVTSYTLTPPAAQLRALSVNGTTVTIGTATVLSGAGATSGSIVASGPVVIAVSCTSGSIPVTVTPYTVSGTALTIGTGATYGSATGCTIQKLFALGSRWCVINSQSGSVDAAVITLTGTVVTLSGVQLLTGGSCADAMVIGTDKVLVLHPFASSNCNLLTDTAGVASAGTAITASSNSEKACAYTVGTSAIVISSNNVSAGNVMVVGCSGASPVLSINKRVTLASVDLQYPTVTNPMLAKSSVAVFGNNFLQVIATATVGAFSLLRLHGLGNYQLIYKTNYAGSIGTALSMISPGRSDKERWVADNGTQISKVECVQ